MNDGLDRDTELLHNSWEAAAYQNGAAWAIEKLRSEAAEREEKLGNLPSFFWADYLEHELSVHMNPPNLQA